MPTFRKNLNKIHLIFQIIYKKHAPWTANFQFLAKSLECTPGGIYVALCGTNQIEATKLRVHSTNEKVGYNPLSEAEGQTRLSLPAMLNIHEDG